MAFKTVFDADFKYRTADTTDVRRTFARIRREQRKARARSEREGLLTAKVVPIAAPANAPSHWPFPDMDKAAS